MKRAAFIFSAEYWLALLVAVILSPCLSAAVTLTLKGGESVTGDLSRTSPESFYIVDSAGSETEYAMTDLDAGSLVTVESWKKSNPKLIDVYNRIDQPPVPQRTIAPTVPNELRRAGKLGRVSVGVVLDTDGRVVQARVYRAEHEELGAPAVEAAEKWRFSPGMIDGKPVRCYVRIPFVFN